MNNEGSVGGGGSGGSDACTSPTSNGSSASGNDNSLDGARKLPSVVNLLNSPNPSQASAAPAVATQPLTVLYELLQQQQLQEHQIAQTNLTPELSFQKNVRKSYLLSLLHSNSILNVSRPRS